VFVVCWELVFDIPGSHFRLRVVVVNGVGDISMGVPIQERRTGGPLPGEKGGKVNVSQGRGFHGAASRWGEGSVVVP